MGKVSIQELAAVLVERNKLQKKDASKFVTEMFYLIQHGLEQDKIVKVKGLGTFKIIDVDPRESVDVNTGERMLIEGHNKITFIPDSLMKELVNKPFSQFETVVLNDGVDFKEIGEESIPEPAPESVVEKDPDIFEPLPYDEDEVHNSPEEIAPLVEVITTSEPETLNETEALVEEPQAEESTEESKNEEPKVEEPKAKDTTEEEPIGEKPTEEELDNAVEDEEDSHVPWEWVGATVAAFIIGAVFGYLFGKNFSGDNKATQNDEVVIGVEVPPSTKIDTIKTDTIKVAAPKVEAPKVEAPKVEAPNVEVPKAETPKAETSAPKQEIPKAEAPKPEVSVASDKYEQMDNRVRTGAYRIVGTDHVEKVREGDNLTKICRRTIGPDMECYLEVYNGIKATDPLKAGTNIKIPKLELKKKKAK